MHPSHYQITQRDLSIGAACGGGARQLLCAAISLLTAVVVKYSTVAKRQAGFQGCPVMLQVLMKTPLCPRAKRANILRGRNRAATNSDRLERTHVSLVGSSRCEGSPDRSTPTPVRNRLQACQTLSTTLTAYSLRYHSNRTVPLRA